jgi:hypothetical protein
VKYYVVGPPVNGQQEYLFEIAARTLGNGNRYKEIFDLNQGRRQADGGALIDPAVLHPGWVLLLPGDAAGPGVLTGPFPTAGPTPTVEPTPAGTTDPPPVASPAPDDSGSGTLLRLLSLGLIGVIMVLAIGLLRRGTRLTLFGRTPRPETPAFAVEESAPATVAAVGEMADPAPPLGRTPAGPPTMVAVDPHRLVLEAEVTASGSDSAATVRLAGSRLPQLSPAWLWLDTGVPAPAPTYVAVGRGGQGILWLDLVQAPDVVTLTGEARACQRVAARMAEHLVSGAVAVTVVASALGPPVAGAQAVRSLAEAADATEDPPAPQIVFALSGPDDQPAIRRLTGRATPRTVLVLVSEARRGRWSIQLH